MMKYNTLFSPMTIGNVTTKNRIVLSPMSMPTGCIDGCEWSDSYIQFLADRAKGGAGLIVTQCIGADTKVDALAPVIYPTIDPERFKASSKKLLDACHAHGAKVFCMLTGGIGRNGGPGHKTPSPIPYFMEKDKLSEALTVEEIHTKVREFAAAAKIVQDAGFDGIEIHALHWGYLFDEFAHPLCNRRTDEYGGSLKNRLRFLKETIYATRDACGPDYPISVRLAVKTFISGLWMPTLDEKDEAGRTPEEAAEIAKELESYGVSLLNTDMGLYDNWAACMPNVYMPHGITFKYIEPVRRAVKIPILVGGCRIGDGESAEQAIAAGLCDGIAMGRSFLADPDIGEKIRTDRENEIRPCIGCNNCILSEALCGKARCAVNPVDLCEESHLVAPADVKKKVVVIGGGVSGMEAAITAAKRGHTVDLYEKSDKLGGNMLAAGGHPFKEDIRRLTKWFVDELDRQGVTVHMNTELCADEIKALKPDAVMLAVGSTPVMPKSIKGIDKAIDAVSAATGKVKPKGQNVVVAGGGLTGCEIALDYALQGKKVTLVEYEKQLMSVGLVTFPSNVIYLVLMLMGLKVTQLTGHKLDEIRDDAVIVTNVETNESMTIPADDVVVAIGLRSNPSVADELKDCGIEVFQLGDAVSIGNIATSTRSAFEATRNL